VKIILYQGGKDMLSTNLKKKVAVLLTGAMVFGMTVTAAAADPVTVNGSGTNEGHVNKKVVSVTFPTQDEGTGVFDYIADPEGLIAETSAEKYPDATFPSKNTTTHVYFQTDENEYGNESKALTVSNNSSVSINVTVKVEVTPGSDDLDLVSQNALTTAEDPSLYLGLKVTGEETAALTDDGAETTLSMNAAGGYSISWNSTKEKYEYVRAKDAAAAPTFDFSIEGALNVVDTAKGKTAPALKVTWSYVPSETEDEEESTDPGTDPGTDPVAPSIATKTYTYVEGSALEIPVNLGSGDKAATNIAITYTTKSGATKTLVEGTNYSFGNSKISFTADQITAIMNGQDSRSIKITFNDSASTAVDVTLSK
jgi:hypothetical protein